MQADRTTNECLIAIVFRNCRFQTLIAVMLSSQTKDEQTAAAMARLKKHGLSVQRYSMFLLSLGIDYVSVAFILF